MGRVETTIGIRLQRTGHIEEIQNIVDGRAFFVFSN